MSDIYEKVFGSMKHVLTHGGYIEDCEGECLLRRHSCHFP